MSTALQAHPWRIFDDGRFHWFAIEYVGVEDMADFTVDGVYRGRWPINWTDDG